MSIPIRQIPEQICLGNTFHTTVLQTSLKHFVQQFELAGCCLFQLKCEPLWFEPLDCMSIDRESLKRESPSWQLLSYWAETAINDLLPHLVAAIDQQFLSLDSSAEVVRIGHLDSTPYHLYGCLCSSTLQSREYLLCWQAMPLSEHQRYGMSLYAQTVNAQITNAQVANAQTLPSRRSSQPDPFSLQMLHDILQRTRHQLRTPLSLMLLYVDLLKTTTTDRQAQDWLANLRSTTEEMHVSLNYLTEPTHAPDSGIGNVDVRQLFEQCIQEMQPWIEQKQLTLSYNSPPLWLWVNGWKIKQVLQNLLSNAIAFSPAAGQITCDWQIFQSEVLIKLTDNGPGLSAEDLRSIGTPFYSRRPGGTGLGLSIAKQIILEHQGSLWADNLPNGGAQFCITLPKQPRASLA